MEDDCSTVTFPSFSLTTPVSAESKLSFEIVEPKAQPDFDTRTAATIKSYHNQYANVLHSDLAQSGRLVSTAAALPPPEIITQ